MKQVLLVYHGTPVENIQARRRRGLAASDPLLDRDPPPRSQAICRDGLDPARRIGQALGPGEYFGKAPVIALPFW
jgi:hypothetical protein